MKACRVQDAAVCRLDEIYRYTRDRWGDAQAQAYIRGLFDTFERIARCEVGSRPIPAEFGVHGFWRRYERHIVYWKPLADGDAGIVTMLHESMHQGDRFKDDASPDAA